MRKNIFSKNKKINNERNKSNNSLNENNVQEEFFPRFSHNINVKCGHCTQYIYIYMYGNKLRRKKDVYLFDSPSSPSWSGHVWLICVDWTMSGQTSKHGLRHMV